MKPTINSHTCDNKDTKKSIIERVRYSVSIQTTNPENE